MKKKKIILLLFVICLALFGSIYLYVSFKNNIKTKNNSTDNTIINKENKINVNNVTYDKAVCLEPVDNTTWINHDYTFLL